MKKIKKNIIEALDFLKNNPTETLTKVSELFNIDRHTLGEYQKFKINNNNLFQNVKNLEDNYLYFFTNQELEIIKYYERHSEESYKKLKEKYPNAPTKRTLYNWMDILGKTYTTGPLKKYHYDRNKFKEIVSEEDAYWLGFITADGCISENKFLQIKLQKSDTHHLEKFCHYMGLNDEETKLIIKDEFGRAYTRDNPVSKVRICSVDIVNNLMNKGIEPQKSGKEKPFHCSSIELEKAYIRGLIDGDGYLRSTSFGFGVVGSYEICDYVKNFLNKYVISTDTNSITNHGVIKTFEISGKYKSAAVINYLYENASIYLDRKYELYQTRYKNINLENCRG